MKYEDRAIKASFLAGITDILVGIIMHFTGWHEWWYNQFHLFGVIGLGMIAYSFWHYTLKEGYPWNHIKNKLMKQTKR